MLYEVITTEVQCQGNYADFVMKVLLVLIKIALKFLINYIASSK